MTDNSQPATQTRTFLLTDVQGSTRLTESYPAAMRTAMARHDACIGAAVAAAGGKVLKARGEGDSVFTVFDAAGGAVQAAYAIQQALAQEIWSDGLDVRVRIGVHTGEAEWRDNDYRGAEVIRCARLRDIAHGGQVILSERTAREAENALPDGVTLRDMGLHRLKDLRQAEYVFQIVAPDLPSDFPPLRSLSLSPHNLPEAVDSFIGREADVAAIRAALGRNVAAMKAGPQGVRRQTRLLTICGTGGCGKTRLALQSGAELLEEYPDGVWFVDLTGITDGPLVPQAVAAMLDVRETPGGTIGEALIVHCKPKTLLLILDNCEHLLNDCAPLARTLLQSCPNLRVLATSREALNVAGEQVYALSPLETPNPKRLPPPNEIASFAAVQLFAERVQARKPGFTVGPDNAELVAKICSRLDGVPLCLELVAPKATMLTLPQIDARLYTLLRTGGPSAKKQHKNLRSLIEWSADLLTPDERWLLPRLSVFAGGWTLEAAELVCAGNGLDEKQVYDALERLVNASLVIAEPQGDTMRYRLLETVREYAREELAAAEQDIAVQDRHVACFLELAEQWEPKLQGPEQAETLRLLDAEMDNFRAALKCADAEDRLRLAGALWRFWAMRGYWTEGASWLRGGLERGSLAPSGDRAKALRGLGALALRQSNYDMAAQCLNQSLALYREAGNKPGAAECLNSLGTIAREQGDPARAAQLYGQSYTIQQQCGNMHGAATARINLGMAARDAGNYETAQEHYEFCREFFQLAGDSSRLASALSNLGDLEQMQGRYERAQAFFAQALAIFRAQNDQRGIEITLHNLGETSRSRGKTEQAIRYFRDSLTLSHQLQHRYSMRLSLQCIAQIVDERGSLPLAAYCLGAADALNEKPVGEAATPEQDSVRLWINEARSGLDATLFQKHWMAGFQAAQDDVITKISGEIDKADEKMLF